MTPAERLRDQTDNLLRSLIRHREKPCAPVDALIDALGNVSYYLDTSPTARRTVNRVIRLEKGRTTHDHRP